MKAMSLNRTVRNRIRPGQSFNHSSRRRKPLELQSLEDRMVPTSIALLGADYPEWVSDVQSKLEGTGQFSSVTPVDVMFSTPTLAELEAYDAVLVWSDYGFADTTTLGNNLADYVDDGHGVVVSVFANTDYGNLGGRWASGGYDAMQLPAGAIYSEATLGSIAQPGHPILAGVASFDGGSASFRSNGGLTPGTSLVANWSDGTPLVVEKSSRDIGLNMFPPSSDAYYEGWLTGTQGAVLMANALSYVSGFSAGAVSPANGDVVSTPPSDFVVKFSAEYDPASVSAADLTVNENAATSVDLTSATTVTFHFASSPVTSQGLQTIHMDAGAVSPLDGSDSVRELNASFRYDAVLMQVTSTLPANGSSVLLPFTTLDLNFNEPYDPGSADVSDFAVDQGSVVAVSQVDADTLRLTLVDVTVEGTLNVSMADGAMTDVYGNPGTGFSTSYILDFGTVPYPTPLKPRLPRGSLIYEGTQSGIIDPAGDSDSFSILVDPGQKITVGIKPSSTLKPRVELYRRDGNHDVLIASATAAGAGLEAVLQSVSTNGQIGGMGPGPKTYIVTVRGANGTTGSYAVNMTLNAAVESESHDGTSNGTQATAQNLDPAFLNFNASGESEDDGAYPGEAAVVGHLDSSTTTVPGIYQNVETYSANAYPIVLAPFGISDMRYQQVYSASEFSNGGTIDTINLRRYAYANAFSNIDVDVQIRLSYAARTVDTASPVFAENVGAGATTVFDGVLHLSSTGYGSPNPFDVVIDVDNNFSYDPSKGDLLVDFFVRGSSADFYTLFEATPYPGPATTTRIFNFSVNDTSGYVGFFDSDNQPYGLVTQFSFVPPDQDYYRIHMKAGESPRLA